MLLMVLETHAARLSTWQCRLLRLLAVRVLACGDTAGGGRTTKTWPSALTSFTVVTGSSAMGIGTVQAARKERRTLRAHSASASFV
jgi:hypothetical protein